MFEVGKLSDETMENFIEELSNVRFPIESIYYINQMWTTYVALMIISTIAD